MRLWVALIAVASLVTAGCGDDGDDILDASTTSADSTASSEGITIGLDGTRLVLAVPAAGTSYEVTAEVPPEWEVVAADPEVTEINNERWNLVGPDAAITLTVYDVRNTSYEVKDPSADVEDLGDGIYDFTRNELFPADGGIGNTEEVEVGGFPAFDLGLFNSETLDDPLLALSPMFVIALDGPYYVTLATGFSADEDAAAAESAFSTITRTLAITQN